MEPNIPDPLYGLIRSAVADPNVRRTIYKEIEKLKECNCETCT